jgi:hypothetical protein
MGRSPISHDISKIDNSTDNIDTEGRVGWLSFLVQVINDLKPDPGRRGKMRTRIRQIPEMKMIKEVSPERTALQNEYDPYLDRGEY